MGQEWMRTELSPGRPEALPWLPTGWPLPHPPLLFAPGIKISLQSVLGTDDLSLPWVWFPYDWTSCDFGGSWASGWGGLFQE